MSYCAGGDSADERRHRLAVGAQLEPVRARAQRAGHPRRLRRPPAAPAAPAARADIRQAGERCADRLRHRRGRAREAGRSCASYRPTAATRRPAACPRRRSGCARSARTARCSSTPVWRSAPRARRDPTPAGRSQAPSPPPPSPWSWCARARSSTASQRSRPPAVRLLAPRRGIRVRSGGRLEVRWQASDPDGGDLHASDRLLARRPHVAHRSTSGPSGGRVTIPGRVLAAGTRARVRLSVTDGFAARTVTSPPFTAEGAAPQVRILAPGHRCPDPLRGAHRCWLGSALDALGPAAHGPGAHLVRRAQAPGHGRTAPLTAGRRDARP